MELLQDKVKFKVENLKLNLLEKKDDENEINDQNDFELEDDNLKINDTKDKEKEEKKDEDEFDDWVFYNGEEVVSVNLGDNKYQEDLLNEYEIIENYDENNGEVATSKKIEV